MARNVDTSFGEGLLEGLREYVQELRLRGITEFGELQSLLEERDELRNENKRLKSAIEAFGSNPAGFDWAVLERLEQQELEIERLNNLLNEEQTND